jgi:Thioesterase-like superfamily
MDSRGCGEGGGGWGLNLEWDADEGDAQNMTGFFILPGKIDMPFTYKVRTLRDGGVYCLRAVEVFQEPYEGLAPSIGTIAEASSNRRGVGQSQIPTPCFTATISFKRKEDPVKFVGFRYQTPHASSGHLSETYASVLDGKKSEDHPIAPGADSGWWTKGLEEGAWEETGLDFPGVEIRKVDMTSYNQELGDQDQAGRWRELSFYRLISDYGNEKAGIEENNTPRLRPPVRLRPQFPVPHPSCSGIRRQICSHLLAIAYCHLSW